MAAPGQASGSRTAAGHGSHGGALRAPPSSFSIAQRPLRRLPSSAGRWHLAVRRPTAPPASGWFYPSGYKGAFCSGGAWIADWTALAEYGVLSSGIPYFDPEDGSSCVTNTEDLVLKSNGYTLSQNNPNPSNGMTSISFELPKTTTVNLTIYNTQGQVIKTILDNSEMSFGINTIEVSTASLQKGIYFYTLQNEEVTITKRMIVQ